MRLLCLASTTIIIVLGSIIVATPINARHDESCKQTILYSLTFPAHKEPKMILCHPVGKALVAANNANIQFNSGVIAGQKALEGAKCPSSNKDFCDGWTFANHGFRGGS